MDLTPYPLSTETPYDSIRRWRRILNIDNQAAELTCTVEESGEYAEADLAEDPDLQRRDAIGDMVVVAVVHWDIDQVNESQLERAGGLPSGMKSLNVEQLILVGEGRIGRGIRKHNASDIRLGCRVMFNAAKKAAEMHGYDFEGDCVKFVVNHLYERLRSGYVMVDGSAIKAKDYERMKAEGTVDPDAEVVRLG